MRRSETFRWLVANLAVGAIIVASTASAEDVSELDSTAAAGSGAYIAASSTPEVDHQGDSSLTSDAASALIDCPAPCAVESVACIGLVEFVSCFCPGNGQWCPGGWEPAGPCFGAWVNDCHP